MRFGSVGGGGRYDGLVSRFRGEPVPATGFSIGVSRLQAALTLLGKLDNKPAPGPVLVTVFDRERVADYQKMVSALRAANIRAELYLGNPKHSVGQQLKYADRRGSPCAIIQGSDEKTKGVVQIKDLILGAELAKLEKGREEHLKKQSRGAARSPASRTRRCRARGARPPRREVGLNLWSVNALRAQKSRQAKSSILGYHDAAARDRKVDLMPKHLLDEVQAVHNRSITHDFVVAKLKKLRALIADNSLGARLNGGHPRKSRGALAFDEKFFQFELGDG